MPRTASTSPYRLTRPETVITVSGPVPPSTCLASRSVPVCPPSRRLTGSRLPGSGSSYERNRVAEPPAVRRYSPSPAGSSSSAARIRYSALRVSVSTLRACAAWASVPALIDLEGRHRDLPDQAAHLDRRAAGAAGHHVPGSVQLVRVRGRVRPALVGQLVGAPAALASLSPDQALILELLERRVDRAGAWPPDSPAALADLLDDLVAVHGLLGEQRERCRPDIAAPGPRPAHAALAAPRAEVRAFRVRRGSRDRQGSPDRRNGPAKCPRPRPRPRPAVPLLAVAVPAAPLAVVGGLPPAWCAALAALFVVSHWSCSLCCELRICLSPTSSACHRSSSIRQRYIVNFFMASPGAS